MAHAWLDSLSEDWVSQPRSDDSAIQLPTLPKTEDDSKLDSQEQPSRIPRRAVGARSSAANIADVSVNILSERSANDINISMRRGPAHTAAKYLQSKNDRAISGSSNGSVVHHTIHHHSSARKAGQTPEWKRRLVQGDMPYGAQRDLFCSTAEGLQDMFKPPPPPLTTVDAEVDELPGDSTMPSSPPVHRRTSVDLLEEVDDFEEEQQEDPLEVTPSPSPRKAKRDIKYKLNVDDMSAMLSSPSMAATQRVITQDELEEHMQDDSRVSAGSGFKSSLRKVSGQSDTRNEDFSPIMIGKHSGDEGKVEFAPIEMPADALKAKLERIRISQMLLDSQADLEQGFEDDDSVAQEFESTEEYGRQGGFLNTKRGGRSAEGSFRHRALSPGFGVDTSEMLAEESLQASTPKQYPTYRTDLLSEKNSLRSPTLPRAPFPSPEKRQVRNGKENLEPGGSPLKLFGPYDTFTNQTLLRRISQFEEGMSASPSQQSFDAGANDGLSRVSNPQQLERSPLSAAGSRSVSEFGAGDLEGFEFSSDLSAAAEGESEDEERMPAERRIPTGPRYPVQHDDSLPEEDSEIVIRRRRYRSTPSSGGKQRRIISMSDHKRVSGDYPQGSPGDSGTPNRDHGSETKRPRTSPSKDPTPKRRRTLHRSDIAFGRESLAGIDVAHQQIQSAMQKKPPEMQASTFGIAHPASLSSRHILRPRLPSSTLSPISTDPNLKLSPRSPRGTSARSPAGNTASRPGTAPIESDRKPSIRTQDFVDQAAQIMAMIRSQVKPGLASLEESGEEHDRPSPSLSDSMGSESSREPFSRPPSREGKPALTRPAHMQNDPHLAQRLKKYQELSDMGDVITSSLRSMELAKDAVLVGKETERHFQQHYDESGPLDADGGDIVSDMPHVRIITNPLHQNSTGSPGRDFPSSSSNRSYPTGSSRGSESRRTIMPESVSHLIPERVGSMCLDKSKNLWIKNKESAPPPPVNVLPSDSEDDPFASIPDLSVDLTKELQNLKLTTARKESATADPEDCPSPTSPIAVEHTPVRPGLFTFTPEEYLGAQAASAAGQESSGILVSDLPSSDSVEDGEFAQAENPHVNDLQPTRRRNLTISFSSPVASIIREVQPEDLDSLEDDPESDGLEGDSVDMPGMTNKAKPVLKSARGTPRPLSSRDPNFHPRPVSRIDEQDEDSTVELPHDDQRQISIIGDTSMVSHKTPDGRRTSVSFILNGHPGNQALSVRGDDSAIISHNVGKLSLSPLSEFTLNNSDQSFGFEVSYVMGHRHMETGDGTKKVMSMTIRDLVDRLGEVEPFEPYWEDMEELDLQDKRLTSLHMLDEFCSKVVTLDASKNALGHLDGVPPTVRNLKVSENMLTELTAWDHLNNLQYIDISGNEVKSLSALKNLFHLRSIKADNNQLTSLDGLDCHDGLLSLRARNNLIEEVDFAFVKLERLSDLDLAGNEISSIQNLELLPALGRLKLSKNKLQQLSLKASMKTLRQLDVNDNELDRLDLSGMPNLHSLHADRNRISSIMGFNKARRLDSLSLREQRGEEPLDLGFLSAACEVRKLFLSGNYLRVFEPQVDFLNLQLLELANCGLQALPANIGQLMPNVRTLNLNFNAISDLSPLRFIPRLKKLVVAGNRLGDSTAVTELLTDFPHLAQLDLRDNPVTLGFYAPLQVLVSTKDGGEVDPFVLPPADAERDDLFAKRLDEATRLRRRLHQIVFAASCKRLRMLDGLPVKRSDVFAKDAVLIKLIDEGLLPRLDELNEDAVATSPRLTVSRPVEDEEEVAQEYDGERTATRVPNGVSG